MNIRGGQHMRVLWKQATKDLLDIELPENVIETLSLQTIDSIRRVNIYEAYERRAKRADLLSECYYHTSNPFVLCQREGLSLDYKVWYLYLATYFGKSNRSKWKLFDNAAFKKDKSLIELSSILENRESYYRYLISIDFFADSSYSNHRKYTKKSIEGEKGVVISMDYFLDNLKDFSYTQPIEYDLVYKKALNIPNFGRMGAFDFVCNLCKCNLNVEPPISMYHHNSTGPLRALKALLVLAGINDPDKGLQVKMGDDLLSWFIENSNIKMIAQVLEDAICNWQKSPTDYRRYFG